MFYKWSVIILCVVILGKEVSAPIIRRENIHKYKDDRYYEILKNARAEKAIIVWEGMFLWFWPSLELCKALKSSCKYGWNNVYCSEPMLTGIKASFICDINYTTINPSNLSTIVCSKSGDRKEMLFHCMHVKEYITNQILKYNNRSIQTADKAKMAPLERCEALEPNSRGSRVSCTYGWNYVNCSLPMLPGTKASFECDIDYITMNPSYLSTILCLQSGDWEKTLFQCVPIKDYVMDQILDNYGSDAYYHLMSIADNVTMEPVERCKALNSFGFRVSCTYGRNYANCSEPMLPGTKASFECDINYITINPSSSSTIVCLHSGDWEETLFHCKPKCGIANDAGVVPTAKKGKPAREGEFPWNVGLYIKDAYGKWYLICGGTLISPHIVLTAAHCVRNDTSELNYKPEEVKIGLGKFFREWNLDEPRAVKADVREIVVQTYFEGKKTLLDQDLALVDLVHSVRVTAFIMPACVDYERQFVIEPGMIGAMSGWGIADSNEPSIGLMTLRLPMVERKECLEKYPPRARPFLLSDKFCAGYRNGPKISLGDSGAGLTFEHFDGLYKLHRVIGIASSTVLKENTYGLFTNISTVQHNKFLKDTVKELNKKHTET